MKKFFKWALNSVFPTPTGLALWEGQPNKVEPSSTEKSDGFRPDGGVDAPRINYLFSDLYDRQYDQSFAGFSSCQSKLTDITNPPGCAVFGRDSGVWYSMHKDTGSTNIMTVRSNGNQSSSRSGVNFSGVNAHAYMAYGDWVHGSVIGAVGGVAFFGKRNSVNTLWYLPDNKFFDTPLVTAGMTADTYKDLKWNGLTTVGQAQLYVLGANRLARLTNNAWTDIGYPTTSFQDSLLGIRSDTGAGLAIHSTGSNLALRIVAGLTGASGRSEVTINMNGDALPSTWATPFVGRPVWDSINGRWVCCMGDAASGTYSIYMRYSTDNGQTWQRLGGVRDFAIGNLYELASGILIGMAYPFDFRPTATLLGTKQPKVLISFDSGLTWRQTGIEFGNVVSAVSTFRTDCGLAVGNGYICAWSGVGEFLAAGPLGELQSA